MSLADILIRAIYGRQDETPSAGVSVAPVAPGSPTSAPGPQRHTREFIAAVSAPRPITDLCNQGGHYECGRCGCGCHPPLTGLST